MPPTTSQPQLPRNFVADLVKQPWMKTSAIWSLVAVEAAHELRCCVVDPTRDVNAEIHIGGCTGGTFQALDEMRELPLADQDLFKVSLSSFQRTLRGGQVVQELSRYDAYTALNAAIDYADPIAACETIRLGSLIDTVNGRGQTPLLHALERIYDVQDIYDQMSAPGIDQVMPFRRRIHEDLKERLKYIIRVLVEQHANVNATSVWQGKTVTPLYLAACVACDFDLVSLLLTHGAKSAPSHPASSILANLRNESDARRFQELAAKELGTGNARSRPPRLCPCFSGKALAQCHDAGQDLAYPVDLLCPCGSKKVYGSCCKRRKVVFEEKWDDNREWIQSHEMVHMSMQMPKSIAKEYDNMFDEYKAKTGQDYVNMGKFAEHFGIGKADDPLITPQVEADRMRLIVRACKSKDVDPAFAWACLQNGRGYFPVPQGRTCSKISCLAEQKRWNASVDKYIALGVDSRSPDEISCASKVSASLGPLYRTCEGEGCKINKDINKTCSHCKMAFYCSTQCQKSAWKRHKKTCGSDNQREIALPSTTAMLKDFHSAVEQMIARL